MNFSIRLRELRQVRKITQATIAEEIGITERQYQRLEANKSKPMYDKLIAIADYYDISLDYLVGRSDDPTRH